jgi:hypothetical protein
LITATADAVSISAQPTAESDTPQPLLGNEAQRCAQNCARRQCTAYVRYVTWEADHQSGNYNPPSANCPVSGYVYRVAYVILNISKELIPKLRRPLRQCPVVTDNRSEMEQTLNQLSKRYDMLQCSTWWEHGKSDCGKPNVAFVCQEACHHCKYATVDNDIGMLSSASFRRVAEIKRGGRQHCQHSPYISYCSVSATCTTV